MSKKYLKMCNTMFGLEFDIQYNYWRNIGISLWKYDNLPENVTSEIIEEKFFDFIFFQ